MEVTISPVPSDAEAAAIVAAVEALWPKPAPATAHPTDVRVSSWRFSGRWWTTPVPVRRNRPWR